MIQPSPNQQALLGRQPPAASGLSSYAPGAPGAGFAPPAILPAQEEGDALHSEWRGATLTVPVAKVAQVYDLLLSEVQSAVQDVADELQWCPVPVRSSCFFGVLLNVARFHTQRL